MNAPFFGFGSVGYLGQRRCFFKAAGATARFASTVSVVVCSLAAGAALAEVNEPLVDRHDFLNSPTKLNSERATGDLEELFWMCDYAASVDDLDAGQIDLCRAVAAQLKRVKFDDDADAFGAWRRLNQAMAHEQLAAGSSEPSCQQAASQIESRS